MASKIKPIDEFHNEADVCPRRAVPLSTRQIIVIAISLALFSFLYLVYAQHHALLFYTMTGFICIYILFLYTSGILAILYMVIYDYDVSAIEKTSVVVGLEENESQM